MVLHSFCAAVLLLIVIVILTDQKFSCFYVAVFYHFDSSNVFFISLLDVVFTLRCLQYVKVPTSESHRVCYRGVERLFQC